MKKILLATNIIAIAVIYFQSCTTSNHAAMTDAKTTVQNYSATTFTGLNSQLIKQMVQNYHNDPSYSAWTKNDSNPSDDARSIWFSLDTLKKFIWYVETQSATKGIPNLEKLGVRLYYGRYPKQILNARFPEMAGMPDNYVNRHTTFMLPTWFDGKYNVDFDPNITDGSTPKSLKPLINQESSTVITCLRTMTADPSNNMMQNHGDLIPPMTSPDYRGAEVMMASDGF